MACCRFGGTECSSVCMGPFEGDFHYLHYLHHQFSSVQSLTHVRLFVTPWITAHQASLSITNCRSLPKPKSTESVIPSNHLILCHPLLLLPSIFPSIRVFSNESALCIRWPKDWSFNFNISPSNEYPGLIYFRMDWLHLLAVQGTLKRLLHHHSSKASILRHSAFFIVYLSHPYMTTGKTIALTRWTFVGKVMSLLFNMLSRLVTTFLPGSKHLYMYHIFFIHSSLMDIYVVSMAVSLLNNYIQPSSVFLASLLRAPQWCQWFRHTPLHPFSSTTSH